MVKGEKSVSENKHYEDNEEVKDKSEESSVVDETAETAEVLEDLEFEGVCQDSCSDASKALEEELKNSLLKIEEENKKLVNEIETYKERLSRTAAEYDNFRKRTVKEKEGIYTEACEDVLKNILPVLDNLERAYTVDGSIDDIKKGIEMTIRQFNDALSKLQIEEIATDAEFDPNFHNAVMHIEDETLGKNSIVEVFQKGYKKGNKVLRFSMVKVAN
jgi:molecular chaperone GrpE